MSLLRLAACVAVAAAVVGQEPTFRTTTRLVQVSFVAHDKDGKPVTDLRKDEIVVQASGKPRELAFFRFDGASTMPVSRPKLPANTYTNVGESAGQLRNVTAVLLDSLNTHPVHMPWARATVIRYLRNVTPDTRLALYTLGNRLEILHDFSNDPESLRSKLAAAPNQLAGRDEQEVQRLAEQFDSMIEQLGRAVVSPELMQFFMRTLEAEFEMAERIKHTRAQFTMASLDALGRHLSGIPGRKNLVWIGGGIPMLSMSPERRVYNLEELFIRTAERLAGYGVALYVVDAKGLQAPVPQQQSRLPMEPINNDPRLGMMLMASMTGGRALMTTNDMADGLRKAARDSQSGYSAAFYAAEEDERPGRWQKLSVRSTRSGVRILHKEGYLPDFRPKQVADLNKEQWRSLVANPLGSSAIAMFAQIKRGTDPATVSLLVQIDPDTLTFRDSGTQRETDIEVCVADRTPDGWKTFFLDAAKLGVAADKWKSGQTKPIPYMREWRTPEGASAIRVVVRDRLSGRFGTLDIPLRGQ